MRSRERVIRAIEMSGPDRTLPRGSPDDVRTAVRADVDTYGAHRGSSPAAGG